MLMVQWVGSPGRVSSQSSSWPTWIRTFTGAEHVSLWPLYEYLAAGKLWEPPTRLIIPVIWIGTGTAGHSRDSRLSIGMWMNEWRGCHYHECNSPKAEIPLLVGESIDHYHHYPNAVRLSIFICSQPNVKAHPFFFCMSPRRMLNNLTPNN